MPFSARRRWLLPAAGCVVAALLIGAAAVAATRGSEPAREALPVTATPAGTTPTPGETATPTAAATPTLAAPPPTAGPSATPAGRRAPARPAPARTTAPRRTPPPTKKPACVARGVVDVPNPYTFGKITVSARVKDANQICPGERIKVTWVSYGPAAGGGSTLYRSASHYLDRAHPTWTFTVVTPDVCDDSWYVVTGNVAIPSTLKKGVTPFGLAKVHWDGPRPC